MSRDHKHHVCPPSVAKWLNSPIRTLFENPKRLMEPYIKSGDTIIDLGCGGGIFSVVAAQLTGPTGQVIAVDMQSEMFEILGKLARRRGVFDRIRTHQCKPDSIDLDGEQADLVLAVHVVHETPDAATFVREAAELVKKNGYLLLLEPKGHASPEEIDHAIQVAKDAGLSPVKDMKNMGSKGVVFCREG